MKTLLLNSTYEGISFISYRKVFKLYAKGKVEVLSEWDDSIYWGNGGMNIPAVIKLNYRVRWIPRNIKFNRFGVFRRDKYTCQYCGDKISPSKLTIDHINPKSKGGKSDWLNVISSCLVCNNSKGNRTPEEANMRILKNPIIPKVNLANEIEFMSLTHNDWKMYLGIL